MPQFETPVDKINIMALARRIERKFENPKNWNCLVNEQCDPGIKSLLIDSTDKHKLDDLYNGIQELNVSDEAVKEFYQRGEISPANLGIEKIYPNEFVVGNTEFSYNKIIGRFDAHKNKIVTLKNEDASVFGIKAKDLR